MSRYSRWIGGGLMSCMGQLSSYYRTNPWSTENVETSFFLCDSLPLSSPLEKSANSLINSGNLKMRAFLVHGQRWFHDNHNCRIESGVFTRRKWTFCEKASSSWCSLGRTGPPAHIYLTGAHGTGKTTLATQMKNLPLLQDYVHISEVARTLMKDRGISRDDLSDDQVFAELQVRRIVIVNLMQAKIISLICKLARRTEESWAVASLDAKAPSIKLVCCIRVSRAFHRVASTPFWQNFFLSIHQFPSFHSCSQRRPVWHFAAENLSRLACNALMIHEVLTCLACGNRSACSWLLRIRSQSSWLQDIGPVPISYVGDLSIFDALAFLVGAW